MDAAQESRIWEGVTSAAKPFGALALIVGFVLWSHFGSHIPVFRSHVASEPGWDQFRARYRVSDFGEDGHFVRAAQNGYNLFFFTHKYAWRFTRKTRTD